MKLNRAFSLVELVLAISLFSIISIVLYNFFQHYSRSYFRIDDKIESVTEAWQLLRFINEDLFCCDFPDADPKKWSSVIEQIPSGGYQLWRRRSDKLEKITYNFDEKKGQISREENGKFINMMNNRCKQFSIVSISNPSDNPKEIYFELEFELENMNKKPESYIPLKIKRKIFPVFLNFKLRKGFVFEGLPE
ncbi:MAG: prepilin-type N-terminal cleavage/methylation domain-containing protein [Candidatus Riflebacteria bacterium]|nr:prepilin-type N-terminal cleavage/methylation domain-containing protein [Candidatus Riflebacteria bacterium]